MNLHVLCSTVLGEEPLRILPVSGGCIASACKVEFVRHPPVFVKSMPGPDPFAAEAEGLRHLRVAGGVRVPEVMHTEPGVLMLEWIELCPPDRQAWARFGELLAVTHRHCAEGFGFPVDSLIGTLPQKNLPWIAFEPGAWAEFWWSHRLEPVIRRLPPELACRFARLESRVAGVIGDDGERPRILHGDLWHGNAACDAGGVPVMFDPAAYYGHREADLAMTRMFGAFDPVFYEAYSAASPLAPEWEERQDMYMLYPVLNHLLLFGSAYLSQAENILKRHMDVSGRAGRLPKA